MIVTNYSNTSVCALINERFWKKMFSIPHYLHASFQPLETELRATAHHNKVIPHPLTILQCLACPSLLNNSKFRSNDYKFFVCVYYGKVHSATFPAKCSALLVTCSVEDIRVRHLL